jgi:hypothetical protein
MIRYCTFFDQRYLDRGLAMMRSLRRFEPGSHLTVLCLTASCEVAMARLGEPDTELIALADFERAHPDLLAVKSERSPRDYIFALSSCIVAEVLEQAAPGDLVVYLDADLFFYASPAPLVQAMAGASVGLIAHRHHWWAKRLEKYGRFNVGWVGIRCDDSGRAVARWWRERCIEWCFAYVEGDRFADQKYLDHIFEKIPHVVEIAHPGANLGPWNICRHSIAPGPDGGFVVDGAFPLIFYHYSQVIEAAPNLYQCSNVSYLGPFSRKVRELLYKPYLAGLKQIAEEIGGVPQEATPDLRGSPPARRFRIAPLLTLAGRWMGHYIDLTPAKR